MRVLTFDPQFHSAVWSGRKSSTIRVLERRVQPGEQLSLRKWDGRPYGKGVKQVELRSAVCKFVTPILIRLDSEGALVVVYYPGNSERERKLDAGTLFALALQEGFDDEGQMRSYFIGSGAIGLWKTFVGDLIEW